MSVESIESRIAAAMAPESAAEPVEPTAVAEPETAIAEEPTVEAAESENAEPQAEVAVESESADEEVVEVTNFTELAEHLGMDVADLYALQIGVTDPDGKKVSVSVGEWKDGYQSSKMYAKAQSELKAQREAFDQQRQQYEQQVQAQYTQAHGLMEAAEKQLLGDMERIDWQSLRSDDPAEYAAKRQEMIERQRILEEAKGKIGSELANKQRERQEASERQQAELRQREAAALTEAIPEWQDESRANAEKAEVSTYLAGMGFSQQDISGIADHRAILLARKAMMYDKSVAKADVAKKKVVKIGKTVLRPGSKPSTGEIAQDTLNSRKAAFRKSGGKDMKQAARLISDLL